MISTVPEAVRLGTKNTPLLHIWVFEDPPFVQNFIKPKSGIRTNR